MKKLLKRDILIGLGFLIGGLILGWLIFGGSNREGDPRESTRNETERDGHEHEQATLWTCAMHPQVLVNQPGQCPICGMELIPATTSGEEEVDAFTVSMSDAAMGIAEVETFIVGRKAPSKEIYLPGKVVPDERRITQLTAHFPGRIEVLYVNYTGQKVTKGQVIAKIYSPELVTAQKELFEAIKLKASIPQFYGAARNKLKLWLLTDDQIDQIERSGKVQFYYDILSPISGTVTQRNVDNGDHVMEGMSLVEIIDLRHVWVMFDAYETDIPWVKLGDRIRFSIKSIPGREFISPVTFIDPVIDPVTRVASLRTELDNPGEILKPQMLASGVLETMLPGIKDGIVVPKSAVLWTGKNAVVYVKNPNSSKNLFSYRQITLGADAGEYYVVAEGLVEGEEVATNGVFKIDAAAQLLGKRSMMNPEGGKQSLDGHAGMDMGARKPAEDLSLHQNRTSDPSSAIDMEVSAHFKDQLTSVFDRYLKLRDSFVDGDIRGVTIASANVSEALSRVDKRLVTGKMHTMWMQQLQGLNSHLGLMESGKNLEVQRLAFANFNEIFYKSVKHFGLKGRIVYYQFCPMARDYKGAYWLSEEEAIRNPYFDGTAMGNCGETKEVLR